MGALNQTLGIVIFYSVLIDEQRMGGDFQTMHLTFILLRDSLLRASIYVALKGKVHDNRGYKHLPLLIQESEQWTF
jgi:hypothetical protein